MSDPAQSAGSSTVKPRVAWVANKQNADRIYVAELLVHASGLIAIAVLAVLAVRALPTPSQVNTCASASHVNDWVGYGLAACAFGGALLGRGIGLLRRRLRSELALTTPDPPLAPAEAGHESKRVSLGRRVLGLHLTHRAQGPINTGSVFELAAGIFLVVAALVLGYETWSVANGWSPPPVTSYVRCAAYYHPFISAGTVATIGFVLSSWLWYPPRKSPVPGLGA
jgi:hypothetical protein